MIFDSYTPHSDAERALWQLLETNEDWTRLGFQSFKGVDGELIPWKLGGLAHSDSDAPVRALELQASDLSLVNDDGEQPIEGRFSFQTLLEGRLEVSAAGEVHGREAIEPAITVLLGILYSRRGVRFLQQKCIQSFALSGTVLHTLRDKEVLERARGYAWTFRIELQHNPWHIQE